ncbi:hypothetical protein [Ammoniphilus sp. YIM 78166]|uniref:hypothetical protein n=1 Tax=Ammoniphilus sp. YIM 78166 TaxID=1644106 RepID=UPI00106FA3E8|nr:hypothetical protein [Ammoniphilus sp. YIM 78166]
MGTKTKLITGMISGFIVGFFGLYRFILVGGSLNESLVPVAFMTGGFVGAIVNYFQLKKLK